MGRTMMYRPLALALALSLFAAGPVVAQSREQRQMMADIRMLQQQTQQLELTLNTTLITTNTTLNTLTEALRTVSQKLDQQVEANRKTFADLKLLSDNMSGDVRVVREKIDDTNVRLGSLGQEVQAIRTAVQTLSIGASQSPTTGVNPTAGGTTPEEAGAVAPAPAAASTAPAAPPGVSPGQTFAQAEGDYQAGRYSLAIQGFNAYLSYFPTSPDAAKAQYYIGEAYRFDNKLEQALAAYDTVTTNYPASGWIAPARYKRGLVFQQMGRPDAARAEFEAVVRNYPNATEALLAKQRLEAVVAPR